MSDLFLKHEYQFNYCHINNLKMNYLIQIRITDIVIFSLYIYVINFLLNFII